MKFDSYQKYLNLYIIQKIDILYEIYSSVYNLYLKHFWHPVIATFSTIFLLFISSVYKIYIYNKWTFQTDEQWDVASTHGKNVYSLTWIHISFVTIHGLRYWQALLAYLPN